MKASFMQQLNPPARGSVERGTAARPRASAEALGSELSNRLPPDVKWQTQQAPNDALQQPRGDRSRLTICTLWNIMLLFTILRNMRIVLMRNIPALPCGKALYSYEGKEPGDLQFTKGDIIILRRKDEVLTVIRRVDENWAEGMLGDKIGIFPILYVEVQNHSASQRSASDYERESSLGSTFARCSGGLIDVLWALLIRPGPATGGSLIPPPASVLRSDEGLYGAALLRYIKTAAPVIKRANTSRVSKGLPHVS
ncbi:E3 ubiquitin-protein ligase SH3RF1 [Liparis tanakae]|uniref:E3 ubiquitin-protein ligase SH3RF1 n=1 Tax=Liparis tanakae TaxID=230148 RepID=A0A4Z2IXY3_9TELE|nr:E3 ubiquitin-protein ligase SH3RF1 [Liparis tanakae]